MLQTHLIYFWPQLWNQPFLQGFVFLLLEMVLETKIWVPGVLIASGLSHHKGPRNVCTPTQVLIYTHIFHYFYNYPSAPILG